MKCNHYFLATLFSVLFMYGIPLSGWAQQEYDDMYFFKKNKKSKKIIKAESKILAFNSKGDQKSTEELNSSNGENDQFIPATSYYSYYPTQPYYTKDTVVENEGQSHQPTIINNYYGGNMPNYPITQNHVSTGYDPIGWSVNIGYGWGNVWSPYYAPYYYDPFFPTYSYNCHRWYPSAYESYNYGYNQGYHDAYWSNQHKVSKSDEEEKIKTNGPRYSRGSVLATSNNNLSRLSSTSPSRARRSRVSPTKENRVLAASVAVSDKSKRANQTSKRKTANSKEQVSQTVKRSQSRYNQVVHSTPTKVTQKRRTTPVSNTRNRRVVSSTQLSRSSSNSSTKNASRRAPSYNAPSRTSTKSYSSSSSSSRSSSSRPANKSSSSGSRSRSSSSSRSKR